MVFQLKDVSALAGPTKVGTTYSRPTESASHIFLLCFVFFVSPWLVPFPLLTFGDRLPNSKNGFSLKDASPLSGPTKVGTTYSRPTESASHIFLLCFVFFVSPWLVPVP